MCLFRNFKCTRTSSCNTIVTFYVVCGEHKLVSGHTDTDLCDIWHVSPLHRSAQEFSVRRLCPSSSMRRSIPVLSFQESGKSNAKYQLTPPTTFVVWPNSCWSVAPCPFTRTVTARHRLFRGRICGISFRLVLKLQEILLYFAVN